jgi:hypothetical protein
MELVATAKELLFVQRRRVQPIGGLGPRQLAWCTDNLTGFAWPRVQRLADHEKAAAAYRIAQYVDEARGKAEVV